MKLAIAYIVATTAFVVVLQPEAVLDLVRIAAITGICVQAAAVVVIARRYQQAWNAGNRGIAKPSWVWGMGVSYLVPQAGLAYLSLTLLGEPGLIVPREMTSTDILAPVLFLAAGQIGSWFAWLRPLLRQGRRA